MRPNSQDKADQQLLINIVNTVANTGFLSHDDKLIWHIASNRITPAFRYTNAHYHEKKVEEAKSKDWLIEVGSFGEVLEVNQYFYQQSSQDFGNNPELLRQIFTQVEISSMENVIPGMKNEYSKGEIHKLLRNSDVLLNKMLLTGVMQLQKPDLTQDLYNVLFNNGMLKVLAQSLFTHSTTTPPSTANQSMDNDLINWDNFPNSGKKYFTPVEGSVVDQKVLNHFWNNFCDKFGADLSNGVIHIIDDNGHTIDGHAWQNVGANCSVSLEGEQIAYIKKGDKYAGRTHRSTKPKEAQKTRRLVITKPNTHHEPLDNNATQDLPRERKRFVNKTLHILPFCKGTECGNAEMQKWVEKFITQHEYQNAQKSNEEGLDFFSPIGLNMRCISQRLTAAKYQYTKELVDIVEGNYHRLAYAPHKLLCKKRKQAIINVARQFAGDSSISLSKQENSIYTAFFNKLSDFERFTAKVIGKQVDGLNAILVRQCAEEIITSDGKAAIGIGPVETGNTQAPLEFMQENVQKLTNTAYMSLLLLSPDFKTYAYEKLVTKHSDLDKALKQLNEPTLSEMLENIEIFEQLAGDFHKAPSSTKWQFTERRGEASNFIEESKECFNQLYSLVLGKPLTTTQGAAAYHHGGHVERDLHHISS